MNIRLQNAHLDEFVCVDLGCIVSDEELVSIIIEVVIIIVSSNHYRGWVIGRFLGRKGRSVATPFPFSMFEI